MNEVALKAYAAAKQVDGGLEITITGDARTAVAIQSMIPAWAQTMNGHLGWTTKASQLPNGDVLAVTSTDPKEIRHIRGRLYRVAGQWLPTPAAPPHDGEGRVCPLCTKQ